MVSRHFHFATTDAFYVLFQIVTFMVMSIIAATFSTVPFSLSAAALPLDVDGYGFFGDEVNKVRNYRPRSEASEGYVFTGVCHSVIFRGGREVGDHGPGHNTPPPDLDMGPGHNTPLPPGPGHGTWSQHLPPPPGTWTWDLVTTPPSPPPPWTWDLVTTPPSPPPLEHGHGTWSQHLPPPRPPLSPPLDLDMGPGHNTSLPPRDCAQAGGMHPTGIHSC